MKYLLHFHLGPVQTFIGEARRTRDIWAGSFILSWLSAEALSACLGPGPIREERVKSPLSFSSDPIFHAVHNRRSGGAVKGRPVCSTFPNHFSVFVDDPDAGQRAAERVRACWIELGAAVETMLFTTKVGDVALGDKYGHARDLFRAQIGDGKHTPMWEIYTVLEDPKGADAALGAGLPGALDLRKFQRWSDDAAFAPNEQRGGFCSMLPGWQEISSLPVRSEDDVDASWQDVKNARNAFWRDIRNATLVARYGKDFIGKKCLDLVPKERLCAPALVKRLFPLLKDEVLTAIFGWVPFVVGPTVDEIGFQQGRLQRLWQFFFGIPGEETESDRAILTSAVKPGGYTQDPSLWPSTSYMAAAHWIECVHNYAPDLAKTLEREIRAAGTHLAVAERSLFVQCTRTPLGSSPLRGVDGACLYETSLERMKLENGSPAYQSVINALADLASTPLDPTAPGRGRIGRPAPIYAIVRADGDEMGRRLTGNRELSKGLGQFTANLRCGGVDGIGVIARHNGVIMYASADEMIAMCPIEDALDLARAVRETFDDAMSGYSQEVPLTLSVAVTFAHRQVPLTWVMRSGKSLLDAVAKDSVGGNALAVEVLDAGGRYVQWAAPWATTNDRQPINDALDALLELLKLIRGEKASALGSNQFFHDFAARLAPVMLTDDDSSIEARSKAHQSGDEWKVFAGSDRIAGRLLRELVAEHCPSLSKIETDDACEKLTMISGILNTQTHARRSISTLAFSTSGIKLLRVLAENWRRVEAKDQG